MAADSLSAAVCEGDRLIAAGSCGEAALEAVCLSVRIPEGASEALRALLVSFHCCIGL